MTFLHLATVGGSWFMAGLVWWWVLVRIGFRFEIRGRKKALRSVSVPEILLRRQARLEQELASRRSKRAVLN